jgi:hypothetical protein
MQFMAVLWIGIRSGSNECKEEKNFLTENSNIMPKILKVTTPFTSDEKDVTKLTLL